MKALKQLLPGAVLCALMPAAWAASSVDLTVSGSIVPSACVPTLGSTNVDFGKISASDLNTDTPTNLFDSRREQNLNVSCNGPTLYGIRGIDSRAATVGNNWYVSPYGLGQTAQGEKLGAHYLEIFPTRSTIDGQPAFVTVGNADGTGWTASAAGEKAIRNTGQLLGFTSTVGVTTGPVPIQNAVYGLAHYLVIAPANGLTLTEAVALDGRATIEVVYL